jgi:hypothetical protein
LNNNIIFNYYVITLLALEELVQQNEYRFSYFQEILDNLLYLFNVNDSMLIMLRRFLSDDRVIVLSYSHNGIREYFYALQSKQNPKKKDDKNTYNQEIINVI